MKTASGHFNEKPRTRLGLGAVWLGAAFAVLFLINGFVFMRPTFNPSWGPVLLPFYGILMLLCGLGSGVAGFISVIRKHERSWLVLLTLLPGLWVLFMLVGEFLFPH